MMLTVQYDQNTFADDFLYTFHEILITHSIRSTYWSFLEHDVAVGLNFAPVRAA